MPFCTSLVLVLTRADHRGENCKTESKRRLKRKIMFKKKACTIPLNTLGSLGLVLSLSLSFTLQPSVEFYKNE